MTGAAAERGWIPDLWDVEPPRAPEWSPEHWAWIVSRHADAKAVLQSDAYACGDASAELRRVAKRASLAADDLVFFLETTMLMQNGTRHFASRRAFAPMMARLMERWPRARIDTLASGLADALPSGDAVDVVPEFVDAISQTVAADVFGIDAKDINPLIDWAYRVSSTWRPITPLREIARLEPVAREARATLERRGAGEARIGLEIEPPESLAGLEFFLLGASTLTSSGTLAAALMILARFPDLQRLLRSRSDLVDGFVNETLRYAGAVRRLTRRVPTSAVHIGGVAVAAGSPVLLDVERAGRDPLAHRDPQTIDLARDVSGTLAFGGGSHACMGPRLARNQIAAAIVALLGRFTIGPAGEPSFGRSLDIRRFLSLPLRLERSV